MRIALAGLIVAAGFPGHAAAAHAYFCFDVKATIVGTAGDDDIHGTGGRDVIVGLGGNDTIRGLDDADRLCGNGATTS
jgi:Ca2+-binding RTX toxin-like protein